MIKPLLLGLIGFASIQAANATIPLLYCNSCSEASKTTMATTQHLDGADVYIADLNAGTVQAFYTTREIDDTKNPPVPYWAARSDTPTDPYYTDALNLVRFYRTAPIGWQKYYHLTTEGVWTATGVHANLAPMANDSLNIYNVINNGPNADRVSDYVKNSATGQLNGISARMSNVFSEFHIVDSSTVTKDVIEVDFPDGSYMNLDMDYSTAVAKATWDKSTAHDSHHNPVPSTRQQATCTAPGQNGTCEYDFNGPGNPTDQASWQHQMGLLGVTINGLGNGGSGGHWACTSVGEGANTVYSCSLVP